MTVELLQRLEDGVLVLTLNRPDRLNAFSERLERALAETVEGAGRDPSVRVIVVTGAGRAFSAGGDVKTMSAGSDWDRPYAERVERLRGINRMVLSLRNVAKPTMAMVNGVATGLGCNVALACDLRFASAEARFGMAFVGIGAADDGGGAWLLPRLIGYGRALEMLYTARLILAEDALHWGLVNRVVAAEELRDVTMGFAHTLADGPPLALAALKQAVNRALHWSFEDLLEYEAQQQAIVLGTRDFGEGVNAFIERRRPRYEGR